MDQQILARIESETDLIWEIWTASPNERLQMEAAQPRRIRTALKILDCLNQKPQNYEALSEKAKMHWNSCKQYLLAMQRGGIPLKIAGKVAIADTGRPMKIFKIGA